MGQRPAAHHKLLISRLAALSDGRSDRLLVLMPPGSAKSTYASVLFPAWWFSRHPRSSVIAACHTAGLAGYFGRRTRALLDEHGASIGVETRPRSRAGDHWDTLGGGEYFAAGVRGPLTGRRADLAIIDDPVKSFAEADSAAHRDHVWDWFRADLLTRLKPRGKIVLVMTRWHEDDLGGRLLAAHGEASAHGGTHRGAGPGAGSGAGAWDVLRLPAIGPDGAALWPEWESAEQLARKREAMGPRLWSALFQQSPAPDQGALFRIDRVATLSVAPDATRCVRAWDLAATAAATGRDPDWTVGLKLGRDLSGRLTVHDVVRFRGGPHEVEEAVVRTAALDGPSVAIGLPQDPGQAGKQQVAWLAARLAGHRVVTSPETGAKLTRAAPVAAQSDAGNLAVVAAPWTRALLDELRDFPHGRKDDQVDALARAFGMILETPLASRRVQMPILAR